MGVYRATINQPGVRAGKTAPFDDADSEVQLRVASGYLVPFDDVALNYQNELVVVEAPVTDIDAIKAALSAARAQAEAAGSDKDDTPLASFGFAPNAETYLPETGDASD